MKKILVLMSILVLCAFSGCATSGSSNKLSEFVKEDATRAKQMALNSGDVVAAECYQALIDHIPDATVAEPKEGRSGAISAFQKARQLRMEVGSDVPEEVHLKCSPLIVDAQRTMIRLGIRVR